MMLTAEEIEHIRFSFAVIVQRHDMAAMFHARLFDTSPRLRQLFISPTPEKSHDIIHIITRIVDKLNDMDGLTEALQALGRRHMMYGVQMEDFSLAGTALLWTLRQAMGDAYSEAIEDAWRALYAVIIGVVLTGAIASQHATRVPTPRTFP